MRRALILSSSYELFTAEIEKIRRHLISNGYPVAVIEEVHQEFLLNNNIDRDSYQRLEHRMVSTKNKNLDQSYVTIPYVGKPSAKFQRCIYEEMGRNNVQIRVSYQTTKVSSYFSLKHKCSKLFRSNVVYKYTCHCDDGTTYIGETRRQLYRKVTEHTSGKDQESAVFDHIFQCKHCQLVKNISDCFEVIRSCQPGNILSFEAMYISKYRPRLNIQLGPGNGKMVALSLYN